MLCKGAGSTPLHVALEHAEPSETVVSLLLEHRADPNARDAEDRTALHLALYATHICRHAIPATSALFSNLLQRM